MSTKAEKMQFCLHGQKKLELHRRLRSIFFPKNRRFSKNVAHAPFHEISKTSTNPEKKIAVENTV